MRQEGEGEREEGACPGEEPHQQTQGVNRLREGAVENARGAVECERAKEERTLKCWTMERRASVNICKITTSADIRTRPLTYYNNPILFSNHHTTLKVVGVPWQVSETLYGLLCIF